MVCAYAEPWNAMNKLPDGRANSLAIGYEPDPPYRQFIYAADDMSWPYRSINEGEWDSLIGSVPHQPQCPRVIITNPQDARHVYIARGDGVYYSGDFGGTWEHRWDPSLNPSIWTLAMVPGNSGYVYAGCQYSSDYPNTFYYTTDFGYTWHPVLGVPNQTVYDISIFNENTIYAIIENNLYKYDGTNWRPIFSGCKFGKVKVDPNNPQRVFVSMQTILWKSLDGGNNWEPVFYSYPDYITSIEIGPTGWIYVGVYNKGIFRSTTGNPNSFEDITKNIYDRSVLSIKVDPQNPDRIYVGTNFNVYKSPHATLSKEIFAWYEFTKGMRNKNQMVKIKNE